jgi:hypothetical protein
VLDDPDRETPISDLPLRTTQPFHVGEGPQYLRPPAPYHTACSKLSCGIADNVHQLGGHVIDVGVLLVGRDLEVEHAILDDRFGGAA